MSKFEKKEFHLPWKPNRKGPLSEEGIWDLRTLTDVTFESKVPEATLGRGERAGRDSVPLELVAYQPSGMNGFT